MRVLQTINKLLQAGVGACLHLSEPIVHLLLA